MGFASGGAKKTPSFSFCFPSNMFGVNSVSFKLICVFLMSGCSSVSAQSSDENHYDNYSGNYGFLLSFFSFFFFFTLCFLALVLSLRTVGQTDRRRDVPSAHYHFVS